MGGEGFWESWGGDFQLGLGLGKGVFQLRLINNPGRKDSFFFFFLPHSYSPLPFTFIFPKPKARNWDMGYSAFL